MTRIECRDLLNNMGLIKTDIDQWEIPDSFKIELLVRPWVFRSSLLNLTINNYTQDCSLEYGIKKIRNTIQEQLDPDTRIRTFRGDGIWSQIQQGYIY